MKTVMVIYGGKSGEHQVSLRSASFVCNSLKEAGYGIELVGITLQGEWFLQDPMKEYPECLPLEEEDSKRIVLSPGKGFYTESGSKLLASVVFPVIHGTFGEDGTLQGLLEMMDIPYVGAQVLSSAIAMDKIVAKGIWERLNLPVVPYDYVETWQWNSPTFDRNRFISQTIKSLGLPLFIKPANAGSSVGVEKVEQQDEMEDAIERAMGFDHRILIEKGIDAREIELSVIGNHDLQVFPPGEIAPTHSFYDYDAKYIDPNGAALIIPADLSEEKTAEVKDLALKAYRALCLQGLSRVDLFLDRKTNAFYINEINTLPGFTSISMFPMLCKEGGLSHANLMIKLIGEGEALFKEKKNLKFLQMQS